MSKELTVNIIEFKLVDDVNEGVFLEAAEKVSNNFLKKQKGFVSRELLKSKDKWVDIIRWSSAKDAEDSNNNFMSQPDCISCAKLIDGASIKVMQLEQMKDC